MTKSPIEEQTKSSSSATSAASNLYPLENLLNRVSSYLGRAQIEATKIGHVNSTAAVLSTVSANRPSSRVVLIKEISQTGLVFYTNYSSSKAQHLSNNPVASLLFYSEALGEQIRVEGLICKVAQEKSDAYFATRDKESQVGAWASLQSQVMTSQEALRSRYEELSSTHIGKVPRPPHWGGYELQPDYFEFWKAGKHRLHNRESFTISNTEKLYFTKNLLYP